MAYEGDHERFKTAVAIAAAAAAVMPYAYPVAGLIALALSDAFKQDEAGEQWLNPTPIDAGPQASLVGPQVNTQEWRPPMAVQAKGEHAAGASDLTYLRGELKRLSKEIANDAGWAGKAYNSFLEKVQVLDEHLATLDSNRVGTGNTLKASAQATHVLTMFCVSVAVVLAGLASYTVTLRMMANPTGDLTAAKFVRLLYQAMKPVFNKHWKLLLKVGAGLGVATIISNQLTKDLFGIEAVSNSAPEFMKDEELRKASAMWQPAQADMIEDPEALSYTGELDSGLPKFGF